MKKFIKTLSIFFCFIAYFSTQAGFIEDFDKLSIDEKIEKAYRILSEKTPINRTNEELEELIKEEKYQDLIKPILISIYSTECPEELLPLYAKHIPVNHYKILVFGTTNENQKLTEMLIEMYGVLDLPKKIKKEDSSTLLKDLLPLLNEPQKPGDLIFKEHKLTKTDDDFIIDTAVGLETLKRKYRFIQETIHNKGRIPVKMLLLSLNRSKKNFLYDLTCTVYSYFNNNSAIPECWLDEIETTQPVRRLLPRFPAL